MAAAIQAQKSRGTSSENTTGGIVPSMMQHLKDLHDDDVAKDPPVRGSQAADQPGDVPHDGTWRVAKGFHNRATANKPYSLGGSPFTLYSRWMPNGSYQMGTRISAQYLRDTGMTADEAFAQMAEDPATAFMRNMNKLPDAIAAICAEKGLDGTGELSAESNAEFGIEALKRLGMPRTQLESLQREWARRANSENVVPGYEGYEAALAKVRL